MGRRGHCRKWSRVPLNVDILSGDRMEVSIMEGFLEGAPELTFCVKVGVSQGKKWGVCGWRRVLQRVCLISVESHHPVTVSHKSFSNAQLLLAISQTWGEKTVRVGEWSWTMEGEGGPSPGLLHTGIHTTTISLRIQTKVLWRVKEVLLIIISGPRVNWGCPRGLPGGSEVKNPSAMQETWVRSLGQEDSTGEGNGYSLQYSCLENSVDRGAWRSI